MDLRERLAAELGEARRRTEQLLAPVDEARLRAQHDPLLSPLLWDYGHIGVFEELWLVSNLSATPPLDEARLHTYDAFENPRRARGDLPLMDLRTAVAYRDEVRSRALGLLEEVNLDAADPLLRDGFVYSMIVQHEHQHDETLLQTLQVLAGGYRPPLPPAPQVPIGRTVVHDMVPVPAGEYPVGCDDHAPYDNEHPRHTVALRAYAIDRFPVTCSEVAEFIDDGGYRRPELWDPAGRAWLAESGVTAPKHWERDSDGRWWTDRFGHREPVRLDTPVMHVCLHEAAAVARRRGCRLPTEQEWEVAASWDPATGAARRHPWGDCPPEPRHANLDQWLHGCAPVGAYPDGASALGCEQMIGEVWEWTSSHFTAYPGYRTFPYPEYSEVFLGETYTVLRGASWAARPSVARVTFRNWDRPIRRQIFAGFRCARDVQ